MPSTSYQLPAEGRPRTVGMERLSTPPGVMKRTTFLTLENPAHQDAYNKFRMDESSFKLQVVVCIIQLSAMVTHLGGLLSSADRTALTLFIAACKYGSVGMFLLYTLYLARHKRLISCCSCLEKIDPILVCNLGLVLAVSSSSVDLIVASTGKDEDEHIPLYFIVLVLFQMMFARIFFRLAAFWASVSVGVIGTPALAVATLLHGEELPVISLCVLIGLMTVWLVREYEANKINLFVNYANLEYAVRTALTNEFKQKEAERLSEELRSFIGNVAHDLKTPLQAFVSELDALKTGDNKRDRDYSIATLSSTCSFMLMMINRSLDFVKSESGVPLVATMGTVDLKHSLAWVTSCIRRVSDKVPLRVSEISPAVCRCIITDKQWLEENLLCLTSNAIKFTTKGSIDISVSLVAENYFHVNNAHQGIGLSPTRSLSEGVDSPRHSRKIVPVSSDWQSGGAKFLLFEVQDSGIGLTKEQREALFKPFKQAQRKAGGTGLGLYALAKRVEAAGGKYGVSERHDRLCGSLFWFAVPYRPDIMTASSFGNISEESMHEELCLPSGTAATSLEASIRQGCDTANKTAVHVLLVDDAPIIQKTTRRALEREGYVVTVADHGVECLSALESTIVFNVVLLDMQMPVMDGLETIRRIREKEKKDGSIVKQFVIGVSAYSDMETKECALEAGMNDFIIKPLSVTALKQCCQDHHVSMV